jgi:broad specificity phosphatase PhoE
MAATTMLLVRHGATEANLCRPYLLQGLRPDHDLAACGHRQAEATAAALLGYPVAHIYSSPLKRAVQTATILCQRLRVRLDIEEGLVEADVGEWSGLSWDEVARRWPEEYRAFQEDAEQQGYLGGETMAEVRNRVCEVLHALHRQHEEETIVLVSHGVVNRVLLAEGMGLPLRYARRIPQDNGAYNRLELSDRQLQVKTVNVHG